MRRARWYFVLPTLLVVALAPVANAMPKSNDHKEVFTTSSEEIEGILEEACGVDLTVTGAGWVQVRFFGGNSNQVELDVFHSDFRVTNGEGDSIRILDVGPDHYYLDGDGNLIVTITGRSITGSGWIGHVVINLDTGELELAAGNELGDWVENACAVLG